MKVYLFEGFANRLNCLASALATGEPLEVFWSKNVHCPVEFEDVFDRVDGVVSVINEEKEEYPYQISLDRYCWYYPINILKQDHHRFRDNLRDAYQVVFSSLKGREKICSIPENTIGVNFRTFFPNHDVDNYKSFLKKLLLKVKEVGCESVYVTSDRQQIKDQLLKDLDNKGIKGISQNCPLMDSGDLNRSMENVKGFVADLIYLNSCSEYVVNSTRSTIIDPFLGQGKFVTYTYDDKFYRREANPSFYLFENMKILPSFSFKSLGIRVGRELFSKRLKDMRVIMADV